MVRSSFLSKTELPALAIVGFEALKHFKPSKYQRQQLLF